MNFWGAPPAVTRRHSFPMSKRFVVIVGPTGSGKTAVAVELARRIPAEIISCDSMQIYRGMPIATQAPSLRERKSIPFHLTAILPQDSEYSAARFRDEASQSMREIWHRKKVPLVVGGTGLYFRALLDGLFESQKDASKDEAYRKKLLALHEEKSIPFLHEKLKAVDPIAAERIHPNDIRRIVRALEVYHKTRRPISEQQPKREGLRNKFPHAIYFLERDRQDLYERIEARVDQMFRRGLLREVKGLLEKDLSQTAECAIGVREIRDYLEGKVDLQRTKELLKQHTRNYAKRQISWFRHEKGVTHIPVAPTEKPVEIAERILGLCP